MLNYNFNFPQMCPWRRVLRTLEHVTPHNTPWILGRQGWNENMAVFITQCPAVLATYVTA